MKEHYLGHLGASECCSIRMPFQYVMFCVIWYHSYNLKQLLHWCFSHFLNCARGTKSRYTSHIQQVFFVNSMLPPSLDQHSKPTLPLMSFKFFSVEIPCNCTAICCFVDAVKHTQPAFTCLKLTIETLILT